MMNDKIEDSMRGMREISKYIDKQETRYYEVADELQSALLIYSLKDNDKAVKELILKGVPTLQEIGKTIQILKAKYQKTINATEALLDEHGYIQRYVHKNTATVLNLPEYDEADAG